MINSPRNHPWRWAAGILAGLGVAAWIAIGFFGVHTLFVDDVVAEASPSFDAPPAAPPAKPIDDTPVPTAPRAAPAPSTSVASAPSGDSAPAAADVPASTAPVAPTTVAAPEIVTEYAGTFVGESHPTVGDAIVLGNGTGQRFLRFENFETDNGPDLNVYLVNSSTGDVSDYIDLGDLKGNIGEQNYEIPADVDLSVYDTVAIWCVRFSVGFGSAELMPA